MNAEPAIVRADTQGPWPVTPRRFAPLLHARLGLLACAAFAAVLAGCGGGSSSGSASGTAAAGDKALTADAAAAGTSASAAPGAASTAAGAAVTDAATLAAKALVQINAARAVARTCGSVAFAAAAPLAWNAKLEAAATVQSQYMKSIGTLTHTGAGNSTVGDRVTAAGYAWAGVGENIAAGYATIEDAMQGWIDSPGHCANIMNPGFTVVAVALAAGSGAGAFDEYWTMDLALP